MTEKFVKPGTAATVHGLRVTVLARREIATPKNPVQQLSFDLLAANSNAAGSS